MNHPVLSALLPVVLLIAAGVLAGRAGWVRAQGSKELSNLVLMVLMPALMFRTMSRVQAGAFDLRPVAMYLLAALLLFALMLAWQGLNRRGILLALTAVFSNTVAVGISLVGLAYGQDGLVILFALISVHALVLLTLATLLLELAAAREGVLVTAGPRQALRTALLAVRNGIFHPVPLPIIGGLLFAQTGWPMPEVLDRLLQLLSGAFGPLALLLVGVSLAHVPVLAQLKVALALSLLKNLAFPALTGAVCWAMGLSGLPLSVMVVAASLPVGANVFLLSQRYGVAQDLVATSMALSTVLAPVTISLVMALASGLV